MSDGFIQKTGDRECVYLMRNRRNGLVKIGSSLNPKFREKTLHSEEPEIELICYAPAGRGFERELHQVYQEKRVRGEWFQLTEADVRHIDFLLKVENA